MSCDDDAPTSPTASASVAKGGQNLTVKKRDSFYLVYTANSYSFVGTLILSYLLMMMITLMCYNLHLGYRFIPDYVNGVMGK